MRCDVGWNVGFIVWGLFRVHNARFSDIVPTQVPPLANHPFSLSSGFRILRVTVQILGCRVLGVKCRVSGVGCRV